MTSAATPTQPEPHESDDHEAPGKAGASQGASGLSCGARARDELMPATAPQGIAREFAAAVSPTLRVAPPPLGMTSGAERRNAADRREGIADEDEEASGADAYTSARVAAPHSHARDDQGDEGDQGGDGAGSGDDQGDDGDDSGDTADGADEDDPMRFSVYLYAVVLARARQSMRQAARDGERLSLRAAIRDVLVGAWENLDADDLGLGLEDQIDDIAAYARSLRQAPSAAAAAAVEMAADAYAAHALAAIADSHERIETGLRLFFVHWLGADPHSGIAEHFLDTTEMTFTVGTETVALRLTYVPSDAE